MNTPTIADAIISLKVTNWVLRGSPTSEAEFLNMFRRVVGATAEGVSIESSDPADFGIAWAQVQEEVARLEAEYAATEYQRKRIAEYPPMSDYLDGVVKGDQAQIDKYIADCLAVKAKYPKP